MLRKLGINSGIWHVLHICSSSTFVFGTFLEFIFRFFVEQKHFTAPENPLPMMDKKIGILLSVFSEIVKLASVGIT